jgi:hypothetical protein
MAGFWGVIQMLAYEPAGGNCRSVCQKGGMQNGLKDENGHRYVVLRVLLYSNLIIARSSYHSYILLKTTYMTKADVQIRRYHRRPCYTSA